MAANTSPIFKEAVDGKGVSFTSADTTAKKDVVDASNTTTYPDGILVEDINVCSDDTAAVNLMFYLNDGSTDYFLGNVNIPIGSGYTTVSLVKALRTLQPDLNFMTIKSGYKLKAACLATMTAAKTLTVTWQGGPY